MKNFYFFVPGIIALIVMFPKFNRKKEKGRKSPPFLVVAEPGKARGCSANAVVIIFNK